MAKKLPNTPRSKVRAAIRQLFLRSRERAACLKAAGYTCKQCGVKQSKAVGREQKVEVHHTALIQWEEIIDYIFERVLVSPSEMEVLCPECHGKKHNGEKNGK